MTASRNLGVTARRQGRPFILKDPRLIARWCRKVLAGAMDYGSPDGLLARYGFGYTENDPAGDPAAADGEAVVVGVGAGGGVVGAGVLAGGGVAEAEGGGLPCEGVVTVTVAGGVAGEDLGRAVLAADDLPEVPRRLLAGTGVRDGDGAAGTVRGAR
jgi:hypothetical protein